MTEEEKGREGFWAYCPKEEKYRGLDGAIIQEVKGIIIPMYLHHSSGGLSQLAYGTTPTIVAFDNINTLFFNEKVNPLVDELTESEDDVDIILAKHGLVKHELLQELKKDAEIPEKHD